MNSPLVQFGSHRCNPFCSCWAGLSITLKLDTAAHPNERLEWRYAPGARCPIHIAFAF